MGPLVGYGLTIVSGVISGETKTMIISIVIISDGTGSGRLLLSIKSYCRIAT